MAENLDVNLVVLNQVQKVGELVKQQPEGYYVIPDISLANWEDAKVRLLNRLLFALTGLYPQYQWWTTESFFEPGLRVNWRLKT